jgi:hypothetical protein
MRTNKGPSKMQSLLGFSKQNFAGFVVAQFFLVEPGLLSFFRGQIFLGGETHTHTNTQSERSLQAKKQ